MLSRAALRNWDPIDDIFSREPGQLSFSEFYYFHYRKSLSSDAPTYYASIPDRLSWLENEFLWNGFYRKWRSDPHRSWPPEFFFNFLHDGLELRRQMCDDVLRYPIRACRLLLPDALAPVEQVFFSFMKQAKATHDAYHTARRALLSFTRLPIETITIILQYIF